MYLQMSKLVDWMQDLDESMRVAQTYNLDYDEHPITSYSGSIGAPVRNKSLTSDAKRLLNAFDYIKKDRQSQLKNVKEIS